MTIRHDIHWTAIIAPFGRKGLFRVMVEADPDNTVRVYDDVAKHYTTCHRLSERTQKRLVAQARRIQAKLDGGR